MRKLLLGLVLCATCNAASAGVTGFLGYADGANDGVEAALGYQFDIKKTRTSLALHPLQGVFFEGEEPEGFRKETQSNGNKVCRDTSNGQYAEKEKCEPDIEGEYTPSAEILQGLFFANVSIGVGYRGGDDAGVYGLLRFGPPEGLYAAARAGSEYWGVSIGFNFGRPASATTQE